MAPRKSLEIVDLSEIRFRLESVAVAARLGVVLFGAGAAYVGATWDEPQRPLIAALFGALLLIGSAPLALPLERIVRSRLREVFFFTWSALWIAATAGIVGVDGGADTPLVLLFFLPLVFAALSYPLASVVGIGVLVELAFVTVASFSGSPDPVRLGFIATMLAASAVLCAWQAHTHERRRAELESISRADPLTGDAPAAATDCRSCPGWRRDRR